MIACSSEEKDMSKFDFSDPELIPEGIKEWIQVKSNIQLSLPDSIIMGKVLQVEFSDSEIFLLESGMNASILVFGRDGTFKRRLFKSGNGPGEYAQIDFFLLRESSILIYDRSQQKFIDYQKKDFSSFEESKTMDYFMGGIGGFVGDGLFLVSDSEMQENLYKGYGFSNGDISQIDYSVENPGYIEAFLPQSISENGAEKWLVQSFSEKVFRITLDSLMLIRQIDFGSKKIPDEVASLSDAYELYEVIDQGAYYFAVHNLIWREDLVGFNFFNETIDNLNFGLIQNGKAYRFSIDSDLKELFLKPIAVRKGLFHTVLLPGEYDEEAIELLNLTEVDDEKPILVSYTIGQ
jgi:hypothetical protein